MYQTYPVEVLSVPAKGTDAKPGSSSNWMTQIDGKGKKILVVDDEFLIRHMLTDIFTSVNFQVITAVDGMDGVTRFREQQNEFDLVILDMVMPVMDGEQAFYKIRQINPSQKVLICSGYNNIDDVGAMINSGAIGLLPKPFNLRELFEVVSSHLDP